MKFAENPVSKRWQSQIAPPSKCQIVTCLKETSAKLAIYDITCK